MEINGLSESTWLFNRAFAELCSLASFRLMMSKDDISVSNFIQLD